MDILFIFLYAFVALALLCALYLGARVARPMLTPLMKLGTDADSLTGRVFPTLAFIGVLSIILRLTLY